MISFAPEVENALIEHQDTFIWETPAFNTYERGPKWYVAMGLGCLFFLIYAIWTSNFLFAFLILLMAIMIILMGTQQPETVLVQIGENGVVWHGKLHLYQDLEQFAVIYQPPLSKVLYLEHRGLSRPRLRIELQDQDPIEIRAHLRQYLQENLDLQNEYSSDILGRLLKI
jgi:hypothetical protein